MMVPRYCPPTHPLGQAESPPPPAPPRFPWKTLGFVGGIAAMAYGAANSKTTAGKVAMAAGVAAAVAFI